MTYVSQQTPKELRAHMRSLTKMHGWHEPLSDRLWREVQELDAEIERLQAAKRRALAVADERSKENVALRAAIIRIDAINDSPACFNSEINDLCDPFLRPSQALAIADERSKENVALRVSGKRAAEFIRSRDPFGDYFSEHDLRLLSGEPTGALPEPEGEEEGE